MTTRKEAVSRQKGMNTVAKCMTSETNALLPAIADQAAVVQTLGSAIHWINHYPADKY